MGWSEKDFTQGVVVLFDVLGVRNLGVRETIEFLTKWDRLHRRLQEYAEERASDSSHPIWEPPIVDRFGDTMLVTWETHDDNWVAAQGVPFWMSTFFVQAMKEGLPLRGAVSTGSFVHRQEQRIAVGPAIADAASWYDKAQWIGLMATPGCDLVLRRNRTHFTIDEHLCGFPSWIIEYDVPIGDSRSVRTHAMAWPREYFIDAERKRKDARRAFLEDLSRFVIPFGTEAKYMNTVAFYDQTLDWLVQCTGLSPVDEDT